MAKLIDINPFSLNNVHVDQRHQAFVVNNPHVPPIVYNDMFRTFVSTLASKYPLWQFIGFGASTIQTPLALSFEAFKVQHRGQMLGRIGLTYDHNRRQYKLVINNARIASKLERKNERHTSDVKKALNIVHATFGLLTHAEQLEAGDKAAFRHLNVLAVEATTPHNALRHTYNTKLQTWVNSPAVRELFDAHLCETGDAALLEDLENARAKMLYWTSMRDNRGDSTLLVRDGDEYIVRQVDTLVIYNDTNLPDNLRMPLGLLKLVESGHHLEGIGIRANDSTFIIFNQRTGVQE